MRAIPVGPGSEKRVLSEMSKIGYNPCLDRRVLWELCHIPSKKMNLWINKNYIVDHKDIRYAFKVKISKVENKDYLVLKEEDRVRREEDFIPAETSYKKIQQFMLSKKFESLFSNRVKLEEKEAARSRKQKEREEKKKKSASQPRRTEVVLDPKIEEQNSLKARFKHLLSKEGLIPDNVVNKNDLIIEANKKPL